MDSENSHRDKEKHSEGNLTEDNVAIINIEDARAILDRQLTSHQHVQNQAQSIIRLLIALIPIIVTIFLASSGPIPDLPGEAAQREAATGVIAEEAIILSFGLVLAMSAFLVLWAVWLGYVGLATLSGLLSPEQLYPGLGASDDQELVVGSTKTADLNLLGGNYQMSFTDDTEADPSEHYTHWVRKNQDILNREYKRLSWGEYEIVGMIGAMVLAGGLVAGVSTLNFAFALITAGLFVAVPLVWGIALLRQLWRLRKDPDIKTGRQLLSEMKARYMPEVGLDATGPIFFSGFVYSALWLISLALLAVWGSELIY